MHHSPLISKHLLVKTFFFQIATIATQVNKMTSDHVGIYFLHSHTKILATDDASNSYDPHVRANIPSSMDVARIHKIYPLRQMSTCLSSDLLDAYQVIAMEHGISIEEASTYFRSVLGRLVACSHGGEPTDSQHVVAHHTSPPQHTSAGQDTPLPPIHTSIDRTTPSTRVRGFYTSLFMESDIEDDATVGSLHDYDINGII